MENILESVKAAIAGVVLSILFALLLALVATVAPLGETARQVIAQTLKGLSLAVGCFLFFRSEGGWKKGLLAGVIFTLSFSAIGGSFVWSWKMLIDLVLGLGVGVLSGIAAVNLKKA